MLQGSLYETLTRKINRPCNFSYLTCVDIILSGGPSTFFFYFKVRAPRKLFVYNRAPLFLPHHLFCFRTNFLLSNIFLFYPSCPFFSAIIFNTTSSRVLFIFYSNIAFLINRVQLLFLIVPNRANLPTTSSHGA